MTERETIVSEPNERFEPERNYSPPVYGPPSIYRGKEKRNKTDFYLTIALGICIFILAVIIILFILL